MSKNNKTINAIRHGDILLASIKSIPKGLKKSDSSVLLQTGSSGTPHSFTGGIFYPKIEGDFIIGYLKAKGTRLFHSEHSPKGVEIKDGNYEIRRQVEITHTGMAPVVD